MRLEIAAAFTPLAQHEYISEIDCVENATVVVVLKESIPVATVEWITKSLVGIPVSLTDHVITIKLGSLSQRDQVRYIARLVDSALIDSGSTREQVEEVTPIAFNRGDQRDREFLDNVPPHHGV